MKPDGSGAWKKAVMLAPGTYEYKFWADGNWIADTEGTEVCYNCFGTLNNRIVVETKTESSRHAPKR